MPQGIKKKKSSGRKVRRAAVELSNITPYQKRDGSVSYRIRKYSKVKGTSLTRTVTPPADIRSASSLEAFLVKERERFFKEVEGELFTANSRTLFRDYFYGVYKETFTGRPKTWRDYEATISRYAMDFFGDVRMGDIRVQLVKRFLADLRKRVTPSTYNHVVADLQAVLSSAVQDEIMEFNPLLGKVAKRQKYKLNTRVMSNEQMLDIMEAILKENDFWRCLLLTLALTGCRRAEAISLSWEDVHLDAASIHICHSAEYVPGKGVMLVDTKTLESERVEPIPPLLVDALR